MSKVIEKTSIVSVTLTKQDGLSMWAVEAQMGGIRFILIDYASFLISLMGAISALIPSKITFLELLSIMTAATETIFIYK